jgi:hypothetical protein
MSIVAPTNDPTIAPPTAALDGPRLTVVPVFGFIAETGTHDGTGAD